VHGGHTEAAEAALQRLLRDTVQYDRGTVWRDMVALERSRNAATIARTGVAKAPQLRRRGVILAATLVVFAVLMNTELVPHRTQKNCLAMVALLSLLWCTEAIPLYVTSMLVPALTVILGVIPSQDNPDKSLPAPDAAKRVFSVRRRPHARVSAALHQSSTIARGPGANVVEIWDAHACCRSVVAL
jgi:phosphate transporter